jgi:glutamate racemase
VPYGGKTRETIERYSEEIARLLVGEGAKVLVVACNTASALALPKLRRLLPVPVVGVIDPGVEAALSSTRNGHIAVIGTKATIGSAAYEKALLAANPEIRVTSMACPLLVPLIEEGLLEDAITDAVLERYLAPLREADADTLVLGCTHYPLLAAAISRVAGAQVTLVDSAANCARAVHCLLKQRDLCFSGDGGIQLGFTDPPDRFLQVACRVLGLDTVSAEQRLVPPLSR